MANLGIRATPPNVNLGVASRSPHSGQFDDPYVALAQRRHDPPRVFHADCPCLSDQGCLAASMSASSSWRGRKLSITAISSPLPLHQVVALALLKKRDRFASLLDHCLQHPLYLAIGETLGVAASPRGDVALHEPSQNRANG
jgi:hypothetical protein